MPSPVPSSAIRRPMAPRPTTPRRLPRSSRPSYPSRIAHAPRLTARSSSVSRRASASISSSACSLTAAWCGPERARRRYPPSWRPRCRCCRARHRTDRRPRRFGRRRHIVGGDPAPPPRQHRSYLVERHVAVQLRWIRHHPDLVGCFEQREGVGMDRLEQHDHVASRNAGSKRSSSKIEGSTY